MKKSKDFTEIELLFKKLQKNIINSFHGLDQKVKISKTRWKYKSGGGGISLSLIHI